MRRSKSELLNEVRQGEKVISSDKIRTPLEFPRGIRLNGRSYDSLVVVTKRTEENRFVTEICYDEEILTKRYRSEWDDISEVHEDTLNEIRGKYVIEHLNN